MSTKNGLKSKTNKKKTNKMIHIPYSDTSEIVLDNLSKEEQERFYTLYDLEWTNIYVEQEDGNTSVYVSDEGFETDGANACTYLILGNYDDDNGNQIRFVQLTNDPDAYTYWLQASESQGN